MINAREIRKQRGLKQCELARMVGLEQGSLSDIENEKKNPSFDVLIRLALALDCSLDELVDVKSHPAAS